MAPTLTAFQRVNMALAILVGEGKGRSLRPPSAIVLEELAEPDRLWERHDDLNLQIIDCGSAAVYDRAHVPGATRRRQKVHEAGAAPAEWIKDPADPVHVMGSEAFAALMGRFGVSDTTTVVAYSQMMPGRSAWAQDRA